MVAIEAATVGFRAGGHANQQNFLGAALYSSVAPLYQLYEGGFRKVGRRGYPKKRGSLRGLPGQLV